METVKKIDWSINSIGPVLTFVGPWATVQMEAPSCAQCTIQLYLVFPWLPFFLLRGRPLLEGSQCSLERGTQSSSEHIFPHTLITHQRSTARMEPSKAWVLRQNPGCQDQRAFLSRHVLYLEYVCNVWLPLKGWKVKVLLTSGVLSLLLF